MSIPYINTYHFGQIVIDKQTYTRDVIVLPTGVIPNWWRKNGHSLHVDDLQAAFAAAPQVLIIGQGADSRMHIPAETRQAIKDADIELIALATQEACQRYNELREKCPTVAALHLTC